MTDCEWTNVWWACVELRRDISGQSPESCNDRKGAESSPAVWADGGATIVT